MVVKYLIVTYVRTRRMNGLNPIFLVVHTEKVNANFLVDPAEGLMPMSLVG